MARRSIVRVNGLKNDITCGNGLPERMWESAASARISARTTTHDADEFGAAGFNASVQCLSVHETILACARWELLSR